MADDNAVLAASFESLHASLDRWFQDEPAFEDYGKRFGDEYLVPESAPIAPQEELDELYRLSGNRNVLKKAIKEHATAVMVFADQQGIDMAAMLRFMRYIDGRCKLQDVDEQATRDCLERANLRFLAILQSGGVTLDKQSVSVQARIIDQLDKHPESKDWTLRKWAQWLNCSTGAVHKTAAWKAITASREEHKQDQMGRARDRFDD